MEGYKAFKKGLKCLNKQYKENTAFVEKDISMCSKGMHFCKRPYDVIHYYNFTERLEESEFARVESNGTIIIEDNKCCTNKLTIKDIISVDDLITEHILYVFDTINAADVDEVNVVTKTNNDNSSKKGFKTSDNNLIANKNEYSCLSPFGISDANIVYNTSDNNLIVNRSEYSCISSIGNNSAVISNNNKSISSNCGNESISQTKEQWSVAASIGFCSISDCNKYKSAAVNTGYKSSSRANGPMNTAANTGDLSLSLIKHQNSIASNTGFGSLSKNIANYSIAACTGSTSISTSEGKGNISANIGQDSLSEIKDGVQSVAVNVGTSSKSIVTGEYNTAVNSGYYSESIASGKNSIALSTGIFSSASVKENGVAISIGKGAAASGELNSWIVLSEFDGDTLIDVKTFKVDGVTIEPNISYVLKNGKPVKSKGEEENEKTYL